MGMRILIIDFISLDGVVQAPGGPEEDTDGGFRNGGWSMPYFDGTLGSAIDGVMAESEALLFGRRTWSVMGCRTEGVSELVHVPRRETGSGTAARSPSSK